jgi:glycosyltransferase involved in cell wall biosynthesis
MISSLAVVNGLAKSGGGASYGVPALCDALGREGIRQFLLNVHAEGFGEDQLPDPKLVTTVMVKGLNLRLLHLNWSPRFQSKALEICRQENIQILHNHGIWSPVNHGTVRVAKKLKLPFVSTPHGSLTRWSFRHKAWKKKWAWDLYQRGDLEAGRAIHVTAEEEADDLRAIGIRGPLALIPIGVEVPEWREKNKQPQEIKTALFLSRIHPKKGLLTLVEAWAIVRPKGWRMLVVGPDEIGHLAEVQAAVREKGLEKDFVFQGAVYDEAKMELYWNADLFILPTFSENFGLVIPEAMARGLPVLTTQGTPWKELKERSCGWWIPLGKEALAAALREAFGLSDAARREMGIRGRQLVEDKYTWATSAKSMKTLYEWILGGGPPPPFVRFD